MKGFVDDFKYAWNKPNSGLARIIIINVAVFVILNIVGVVSHLGYFVEKASSPYGILLKWLVLSSNLREVLYAPWTLISYFFTHEGFWHILSNMLMLYWFGLIINDLANGKRLVALYIYGGLAGAAAYLVVYNIPLFGFMQSSSMLGASAGVYAVVVGAATLAPNYQMNLLLIGPVRIKYIALVVVFLSYIGTVGANAGGNIAHLGGALLGFFMIRQLQNGSDWSKPIYSLFDTVRDVFTGKFFRRKPKMKVVYREKSYAGQAYGKRNTGRAEEPDQEIIDAILDKISEHGYEKLSAEEKQILFKASQKKN